MSDEEQRALARRRRVVAASLERVAGRYARHELAALWAVLEGRSQAGGAGEAGAAGEGAQAARVAAARAEAASLEAYADASNECGPGFPRDDPGPWHWSALASLTRAAALLDEDLAQAEHALDGAAFASAYPSRALQDEERRRRAEELAE